MRWSQCFYLGWWVALWGRESHRDPSKDPQHPWRGQNKPCWGEGRGGGGCLQWARHVFSKQRRGDQGGTFSRAQGWLLSCWGPSKAGGPLCHGYWGWAGQVAFIPAWTSRSQAGLGCGGRPGPASHRPPSAVPCTYTLPVYPIPHCPGVEVAERTPKASSLSSSCQERA